MYFLALATDYDGTLARDGVVAAETLAALHGFKASGRRLILVTGRQIPDLKAVLPDLTLFDAIVAENGALLQNPATGSERLLVPPPPPAFIARLRALGVTPLEVGRGIVATWEPHEATVLSVIHELGLEMQIIFNKGAVMVLPAGVSKASGLTAALAGFGLSLKNTVGVGDAENDHSFLGICGLSAAVGDATPHVRDSCDIALTGRDGAGVAELTARLLAEDATLAPMARHGILLGRDRGGLPVLLGPSDGHVLLVGPSGSGKSSLATALTEQMVAQGLSFCVMDPEGDYLGLEHAAHIGSPGTPPSVSDALKLKREGGVNLVINTQALPLAGRRRAFARLIAETTALRAETGRPHWLMLDEAHEIAPARHAGPSVSLPEAAPNMIFVTLAPASLDTAVLMRIRTVLAFGDTPRAMLEAVAEQAETPLPALLPMPAPGELLLWQVGTQNAHIVHPLAARQRHHRHLGKYAAGDVGSWHSFYFRGPAGRMNRPARNLFAFMAIAEEIDDETWLFHLRAGDYAAWFRQVIRDPELAQETDAIARDHERTAAASRRAVIRAIRRRYIAPTSNVAVEPAG